MNWRIISLISLGANLALAALLAGRWSHPVAATPLPPRPVQPAATAAEGAPDAASSRPGPPASAATRRQPAFDWRRIESTDFRRYIANLRSVGCPEYVISDIVARDLHAVYDRLRERLDSPPDPWASASVRRAQDARERERRHCLDDEERAAMKELLGLEWSSAVTENWHDDPEISALLGFLPADKAKRLMGAVERYEELADQARDATDGVRLPSDRAAMETLKRQFITELTSLLTPTEWGETRLRIQAIVASFGSDLHFDTLDLTAAQLRDLLTAHMKVFDPFDELFFRNDRSSDGATEEARRAAFEQEVGRLLGDEGLADLKRADDYFYREAVEFTREYALPKSTAIALQTFKNSVQARRDQILEGGTLARDAQAAALARLRETALAELGQVLGPAAIAAYQEKQANWFTGIERLPPARTPTGE